MKKMYVVFYKGTNKIHSYTYDEELINLLDDKYLEIISISDVKEMAMIESTLDDSYLLMEEYDNILNGGESEDFIIYMDEEMIGLDDTCVFLNTLMSACKVKELTNDIEQLSIDMHFAIENAMGWGLCYMYPKINIIVEDFLKDARRIEMKDTLSKMEMGERKYG